MFHVSNYKFYIHNIKANATGAVDTYLTGPRLEAAKC